MRRYMLLTVGLLEQMPAAIRAEKIGSSGGEWQSSLHRHFLVAARLHVSGHAGLLKQPPATTRDSPIGETKVTPR